MSLSDLDIYVAERTRAVCRTVLRWVAVLCVWIAAVYAIAAPRQPWAAYATVFCAVGLVEGALYWLIGRVDTRRIGDVVLAAALAAQLCAHGLLVITDEPAQSVVLVVALLGSAYCIPTVGIAIELSLAALVGWGLLAQQYPADVATHWGMNLFSAACLAVIITAAHVRSLRAQHRLEADLRAASIAAEAAGRAKGDFLATMSHELRTPLHGIFGMTELAIATEDAVERRDYLHAARRCATSLLGLVNDILDFSRIEARQLELEAEPFALGNVVEAVLDTLAVDAARQGLELIGCCDDRLPQLVVGDEQRVRQILTNLGANAVKFTERGHILLRLDVVGDVAPVAGQAFLLRGIVRDTGVGIAPALQEQIFDRFNQGDNSTTRRYGGTGLGLAIVRRLVELMEGRVRVYSAPGAGSTFEFIVRLRAHHIDVAPVVPVLSTRNIGIWDPVPASAQHVSHLLRDRGAAVHTLDAVAPGTLPDVVIANLVDGELPLPAWIEGGAIPVVCLVPVDRTPPRYESGTNVIVRKPIKASTLVASVVQAMSRRVPGRLAS